MDASDLTDRIGGDDGDDDDDDDGDDSDRDCLDKVSSFFMPADSDDNTMDCADDPMRLTDNELSMEGRMEELNNALFMTH